MSDRRHQSPGVGGRVEPGAVRIGQRRDRDRARSTGVPYAPVVSYLDPAQTLPFTVDSLGEDLRELGAVPGATLLVHSSLSSVGYVSGGAHAVVLALLAALGPEGTLVGPTHSSDLSDPALWEHPPVPESWWPTIRDAMAAYDPALTPTRQMGAVADAVRHLPGALRSAHPTDSFCAVGPNATVVTAHHGLTGGLDESSPLARLYELGAKSSSSASATGTTLPYTWLSSGAVPVRRSSRAHPYWSTGGVPGSRSPSSTVTRRNSPR